MRYNHCKDIDMIEELQTSVVIHCAATVRFNDTLRSAIELNLKGVERMIRLCKRMPKLEVIYQVPYNI